MDVRLSPEQRALREAAAHLVDTYAPRTVADLDDAERASKLDTALAGAGWRELRDATEGGQPVAGAVEVAIVAEELGRRVADVAFLGPIAAAELRRRAGLPAASTAETVLLRPDLSGLLVLGADADVDVGDGVAIDARGATSALALVAGVDGYELVAVDLASARIARDLTRGVAAAAGSGSTRRLGGRLPHDELVAWTAFVLALTCADLVGVMRGAVQLARDYATLRHQFGVPIGSFQAVQHLLADAFVASEGSASVTRHAAWAADRLPPQQALQAAAVAKAYCARAARTVCETAIQVHGGIGNTWDCIAHVYLRRALLSSQVLGDSGANLARVIEYQEIGPGTGGIHSGLR
jgi:alkylation response protein AidB-like acyl-CoA dehydrogenase